MEISFRNNNSKKGRRVKHLMEIYLLIEIDFSWLIEEEAEVNQEDLKVLELIRLKGKWKIKGEEQLESKKWVRDKQSRQIFIIINNNALPHSNSCSFINSVYQIISEQMRTFQMKMTLL